MLGGLAKWIRATLNDSRTPPPHSPKLLLFAFGRLLLLLFFLQEMGRKKKKKTLEIGKYILGVNSCVEEGELEAQTRDKKHRDKGNSV